MTTQTTHEYKADPQSGAGNCVCGAAERHRRHPHDFVRAWNPLMAERRDHCTCGLPPEADQHLAGFALPGTDKENT